MDKYNNLNTYNVLYNRPSYLDKTYAIKNINDDNRLAYKFVNFSCKFLLKLPVFKELGTYL